MYDTFEFTLPNTHFDYSDIKTTFENKLQFKSVNTYLRGSSINFSYKNYSFGLSEKRLKVYGSLNKLYHGNNIKNLNFLEAQHALKEFETLFGIPFDDASVGRVDIGSTIQMQHPIALYLDLLIAPEGYSASLIKNETKRFENKQDKLQMYDKVAEAKQDKWCGFKFDKKDYFLRYERTFKKKLLLKLGLCDAKFRDFFDPAIYKVLIDEWYNGYKAIPKLTNPQSIQLNGESLTALKDSIISEHILAHGIASLTDRIKNTEMSKNVRYLARKYFKSLSIPAQLSPVLLNELDSKIADIYYSELARLAILN